MRFPACAALPGWGTFYAFANVDQAMRDVGAADDNAFAEFLINEAGVAVVPGSAFGAPGHVRLSFAASDGHAPGRARPHAAARWPRHPAKQPRLNAGKSAESQRFC